MPELTPSTTALAEAFRAFADAQTIDAQPATLYDPIRYAMAARGKYVRPMLLLQAHALGGDRPVAALPAAYAVELFHNFTLLHDDIMDAADMRRGRPSVHVAFGEPTAILAGDAMLIRSYAYLLQHYDGPMALALLSTFGDMAARLCEGQQRDMDMEAGGGGAYSYPHYLEMIAGKTGVLITASLEMGAIIAGLPQANVDRLARAGDLAGRAFQILDDVLDTFSTREVTGKMDYGDVRRGKQSAPFLRALQLADAHTRETLIGIYGLRPETREPLVPEVLATFSRLGVEADLRGEIDSLTDAALAEVDALDVRPEARDQLRDMLARLGDRKY